jgi:hypothetical protein
MGALRTRHNLSFARVRAVKAILTSRGRLDRLAETGYMQWTPFHARNPDCWMKGLFSPAIGKHLATRGDLSPRTPDLDDRRLVPKSEMATSRSCGLLPDRRHSEGRGDSPVRTLRLPERPVSI